MKLISTGKLSKRKRRELAAKQRGTWGPLNPVTRKPPASGAYRRSREKASCRKGLRQELP